MFHDSRNKGELVYRAGLAEGGGRGQRHRVAGAEVVELLAAGCCSVTSCARCAFSLTPWSQVAELSCPFANR